MFLGYLFMSFMFGDDVVHGSGNPAPSKDSPEQQRSLSSSGLSEGVAHMAVASSQPQIICDQYAYEKPEVLQQLFDYCNGEGKDKWKQDQNIVSIFWQTLKMFGDCNENVEHEQALDALEKLVDKTGDHTIIKVEENEAQESPSTLLSNQAAWMRYMQDPARASAIDEKIHKLNESLCSAVSKIIELSNSKV